MEKEEEIPAVIMRCLIDTNIFVYATTDRDSKT